MKVSWVVLIAAVVALPAVAEEVPELELTPCTVELVCGFKTNGLLASQFDMPDHLIVYSPRMATVRSFPRRLLHALTVNDKRRILNPERKPTDVEKRMLGGAIWPEDLPARGPRPAYATETWEKPKQLLVWAHPGKSGRFEDPKNWLVNGEQMAEWPRPTGEHYGLVFFQSGSTDFLFPSSERQYVIRPRRTNARARHITVEADANAAISLNECVGNIWVQRGAALNGGGGAYLGGSKHTFFVNGRGRLGSPATPEQFAELMRSAQSFARKWVVRKDDPGASITLRGTFKSGDETHWLRGVTILSEHSVISIGPRCVQTVGYEAKLVLHSGAVLGKNGNQLYKNDMLIKGELLAGTPSRPLTRDCYLGISIKDSEGRFLPDNVRYGAKGLMFAPGARMTVYTADPDKARLVVTWHGADPGSDDGSRPGAYEKIPKPERTINVNLYGRTALNDVVFDHVGRGDVRVLGAEEDQKWKRVKFGKHVTAPEGQIVTMVPPDEEIRGEIARDAEARKKPTDKAPPTASNKMGNRYPRILPSGGTFAAGDTVPVHLHALGDPEMRYTTDGSKPGPKATLYTGPFTLSGTTTVSSAIVKAGLYHHPGPRFDRSWGVVEDTFTFIEGARKPDSPTKTRPGLELHVGEAKDFGKLHSGPGEPVHTQTVERFGLRVPEGRMKDSDGYIYTGYIEAGKPGVYRFYTETEGASRLYIGNRLIVDNHRRYRFDWKPTGKAPLESWGSLRLATGKHAIRVEYLRGRGFAWWEPQENEPFTVQYEGPGIGKQPIPAKVLSH